MPSAGRQALVQPSTAQHHICPASRGDEQLPLAGDAGRDTLDGEKGNDHIAGGDDDDQLSGDEGNDTVSGDVGSDSLDGGEGDDSLSGGDGDDTLDGSAGSDKLDGGDGDDDLSGGAGTDTLDGGAGSDNLDGGDGGGTYTGGSGSDQFSVGSGTSTVTDLGKGEYVYVDGQILQGAIVDEGEEIKDSAGNIYNFSGNSSVTITLASGGTVIVNAGSDGVGTGDGSDENPWQVGSIKGGRRDDEDEDDKDEGGGSPPGGGGYGGLLFADPLVLDLDGDGIELTGLSSSTAHFDLDGDGFAEATGWVGADDGFLVVDLDGDGTIDGIDEVFGDTADVPDGYTKLDSYDSNGDGQVDSRDAGWGSLQVWRDANGDGLTQGGELQSLDAAGITTLYLLSAGTSYTVEGTTVSRSGGYALADGTVRDMAEVWFQTDLAASSDAAALEDWTYDADQLRAVSDLPNVLGGALVNDLTTAMLLDSDLQETVTGIATVEVGAIGSDSLYAAVEEMMYQWSGTAEVDASSRGVVIDARRLATMEAFYGYDWDRGVHGGTDPQPEAESTLVDSWQALYESTYARVLLQGSLAEVFPEATVSALDYTITLNITIDEAMTRLTAAAPTDAAAAETWWLGMLPVLSEIVLQLPASEQTSALATIQAALPTSIAAAAGDLLSGSGATLGTDGDDTLTGWGGYASLSGGAGDDTYQLTAGMWHAVISDSAGQDTLALADTTTAEQVRFERLGDDLLVMAGGGVAAELVNHFGTGSGIESLRLADGTAADLTGPLTLTYTSSDDVVTGWDGDDIIAGAGGNDAVTGNTGDDALSGDAGDDALAGDDGADSLAGGDGDDALYGGADADRLQGDAGNDALSGDDGDDTLAGGLGDDTLTGGDGADEIVFARGDGDDLLRAADAADTLRFTGIATTDVTASKSGNDLVFTVAADETGEGGGTDVIQFTGYEQTADITTTTWGGRLYITDTLEHKVITVLGADDPDKQIEAIAFADGSSYAVEDFAALPVTGKDDAEHLIGTAQSNLIDGQGGDDTLEGAAGGDLYVYAAGDGHDTISDNDDSGAGATDLLCLEDGIGVADVTLRRDGRNLYVDVGETGSAVTIAEYFTEDANRIEGILFADGTLWDAAVLDAATLAASDQDDRGFHGTDGADTIDGGSGDDSLIGAAGDDVYVYDSSDGSDTIRDGAGNDVLVLGEGITADDVLLGRQVTLGLYGPVGMTLFLELDGGASLITIADADGVDGAIESVRFADGTEWTVDDLASSVVLGFEGGDWLDGTGDADTLRGRGGNDILQGSGGNDIYEIAGGDGSDTIYDTAGDDTIAFGDGIDAAAVTLRRSGYALSIDTGSGQTVTVSDFFGAKGTIEAITFADGTAWDPTILDVAFTGTAGDDRLDGSADDDTLQGGSGSDAYQYSLGDGHDTIADNNDSGAAATDLLCRDDGIGVAEVTDVTLHCDSRNRRRGLWPDLADLVSARRPAAVKRRLAA